MIKYRVEANLLGFFIEFELWSIWWRIIKPWSSSASSISTWTMICKSKAVLERLKIVIDAGFPGLKLQPFLLHSLLLMSILMTPQCLWVCKFLETVLALELLVIWFIDVVWDFVLGSRFLIFCIRNWVWRIYTFISFGKAFERAFIDCVIWV